MKESTSMKNFFVCALGVGAFAVSLAPPAAAATLAPRTIGPFKDFSQVIEPNGQVIGGPGSTLTTALLWATGPYTSPNSPPWYLAAAPTTPCSYPAPGPGLSCQAIKVSDRISWGTGPDPTITPLRVVGLSYLSVENDGQGPNVDMTTIYGQDTSTDPSVLSITGFDGNSPELVFSNEIVFGWSGQNYEAYSSQLSTLVNLPALLGSDFDLSPFGGDPASKVYVFRTNFPTSELATTVPLPAALPLLASGLAGLGALVRRNGRVRQEA
jgi:hypothetical protein